MDLDATDTPDGPYGYIESGTRHQKAGTSSLKKSLVMPLVAPIVGTTNKPWGLQFFEILKQCNIDIDANAFGALCRAPLRDGSLGRRPLDSSEISAFVCSVLDVSAERRIRSRAVKATTIAWSARYSLSEDARVLLGRQEHQPKPLAVYSRDMLTRPIKQYESMLLTIRNDAYDPDATRSGLMRTTAQDPPVVKIEDTESEFEMPKFAPAVEPMGLEPSGMPEFQDSFGEEYHASYADSSAAIDKSWVPVEDKGSDIDDQTLLSELVGAPASVEVPDSFK